jgi:hypothetical protein
MTESVDLKFVPTNELQEELRKRFLGYAAVGIMDDKEGPTYHFCFGQNSALTFGCLHWGRLKMEALERLRIESEHG